MKFIQNVIWFCAKCLETWITITSNALAYFLSNLYKKITMNYARKTYSGDVKMNLKAVQTSALDGGEWSVSCSGHFTPANMSVVPITEKAVWGPE
jgi:hypothetical protein